MSNIIPPNPDAYATILGYLESLSQRQIQGVVDAAQVLVARTAAFNRVRDRRWERANMIEEFGYAAEVQCGACMVKSSGDRRCIVLGENQRCHCCVKQAKVCSFQKKAAKTPDAGAPVGQVHAGHVPQYDGNPIQYEGSANQYRGAPAQYGEGPNHYELSDSQSGSGASSSGSYSLTRKVEIWQFWNEPKLVVVA
ncbi:hypothetical protein HD553DRAFT_322704 [Filobasidium floriforme]|uniref:uncharacterized protein n=1 Tax=Filobasidium floriforme TaxID=5210 RepID=UPI001E8E45ED|nr:uncharacterized protein HD553DRAFT_322704 [Filobasidium floriforme]KAH8088230.1 hypothetical protein HD553DRAFT_322704 [Filobasidium floriforme]